MCVRVRGHPCVGGWIFKHNVHQCLLVGTPKQWLANAISVLRDAA